MCFNFFVFVENLLLRTVNEKRSVKFIFLLKFQLKAKIPLIPNLLWKYYFISNIFLNRIIIKIYIKALQ